MVLPFAQLVRESREVQVEAFTVLLQTVVEVAAVYKNRHALACVAVAVVILIRGHENVQTIYEIPE